MNTPQEIAIDSALAGIGSKATQAGAATYVASWVLSSEFGVLVGIVVALIGLAVNIYFRRRQDKREEAAHALRMKLAASGREARMALEELHRE